MSCDEREEEFLRKSFHSEGFDILHPFQPEWYNELITRENLTSQLCLLPKSTNNRKCYRAYLVGNTKRMWPHFISWLGSCVRKSLEVNTNGDINVTSEQMDSKSFIPRNSDEIRRSIPNNPLDTFTKDNIQRIMSDYTSKRSLDYEIFWSDDFDNPHRLVSMQRVASVSGQSYFDDHSMLNIHPTYGAWLAFRAVVILFCEQETPSRPELTPNPVPCLLSQNEEIAIQDAMKKALSRIQTKDLCSVLHQGRSCKSESSKDQCENEYDDVYKLWIGVRDCIQIGKKEYRYSNSQLLYHYTKDVDVLVEELKENKFLN